MPFRNSSKQWGHLAKGIHWLSALTIISMFVLGLWMVDLTYYDDWYKTAPFIHKSIGVCLFILTIFRLIWRKTNITPDKLATHTAFEKRAAGITHIALYVIMFCVMITGYLISTADGRAVDVFNFFQIPALIHGIDKQEDIAGDVHFILAILLISIALLHAGAAIKHHFIDKDTTLKRMLKP